MPKSEPYLDPALVEAWAKGGLEPLKLGPFDNLIAQSLRHRLYAIRSAMRRLNHPDVEKANRATVAIRAYTEAQSNIFIYPANQMIEQALANAGITTNEPPPLE